MLFIHSHLRGGGLGTLVEPAKYEPCETACRMAEGGNIPCSRLRRHSVLTTLKLARLVFLVMTCLFMSLRTGIKSFVVEIKK